MKFTVYSAFAMGVVASVAARENSQAFLNRLGVPDHEVRDENARRQIYWPACWCQGGGGGYIVGDRKLIYTLTPT